MRRLNAKPEGPVARRADYRVVLAPHEDAAALVRAWHYSGSTANTSVFAFALVKGAEAVGAMLWMPPAAGTAKQLAVEAGMETKPEIHAFAKRTLNLSRLVVGPDEPQNAESMFLAAATREIARTRRFDVLVTYADGWQGHVGTIYKAAGWTFAGETEPKEVWVDAQGRQVSKITDKGRVVDSHGVSRRSTTTLSHAQMRARGYVLVGKFPKLRFVKVLH